MSDSWQRAYAKLKGFVSENPEIEISSNVVAIPGDIRPRFYRLFDTVRLAFLEERFSTQLEEASSLSGAYIRVEQEVIGLLGLVEVEMFARYSWFLRDPANGLMRGLRDPLFNLLAGEDVEAFEQKASQIIESAFLELYRSGYEKWVILSLLRLLASDKAFKVNILDVLGEDIHSDVEQAREEEVPAPVGSDRLLLKKRISPALFVGPNFIVHSAEIDRYVGLTTELVDTIWTATNASDKREWYRILNPVVKSGYGLIDMQPDFTLTIYVDDSPEDVALIADFRRICRPDLIIKCMAQEGWSEQAALERIKLYHATLKPRLGTYIVSAEPVPEQVYRELVPERVTKESAPGPASREPTKEQEAEKQEGDIHILTVGLDQSKLEPIISVLMNEPGQWETAAVAQDS